MLPDQKPEFSQTAAAKLFLGVAGFVFLAIVMFIIGYIANSRQTPVPPPVFSPAPSRAPLPPLTPEPAPSIPDKIKGWKTYSNPEAVFSFKYPANWSVQNETSNGVTIGSGNDNTLTVGVQEGSPNTSLADNIVFFKNSFDKAGLFYGEVINVQIDGVKAYIDLSTPSSVKQIYLVTADKIVVVIYSYYEYSEATGGEKAKFLAEELLPTFILNDKSFSKDTRGWRTYRSEKYGFEFEYPDNLTIRENSAYKDGFNQVLLQLNKNGNITYIVVRMYGVGKDRTYKDVISENSRLPGGGTSHAEFADFKELKIGGNSYYYRYLCMDPSGSIEEGSTACEFHYFYWLVKGQNIFEFETADILATSIGRPAMENYESSFSNSGLKKILATFKYTGKDLSSSCRVSTVTDVDGNFYYPVKIGDQCWLKQNLKVTKNPQGKPIIRYCYDDDPENCKTDGGLYDWNTAVNGSLKNGPQGICPNGWHVPSISEWDIFEEATKNNSESRADFDGILVGLRNTNGVYSGRNKVVYFWSSTGENTNSNMAQSYFLTSDRGYDFTAVRMLGFSVRCIED